MLKICNLTNRENDFKTQAYENGELAEPVTHLVNPKKEGPSLAKLLVWQILARLSSFA